MDWKNLIYGAIIGGIIGYTIDKLLKLLTNLSFIKQSYKGTYYSYRYSTINDKKIVSHKWRIYRKINGMIGIEIEELNHSNPFRYRGLMRVRDRYMYIHLHGVTHSEEMFYIFPEPIDKSIISLRGILLAVSMENTPWAGEEILVNQNISHQKARNILGPASTINPQQQ